MKRFLLLIAVILVVTMAGCSLAPNISLEKKEDKNAGQANYLLPSDTQVVTEVDLSKLNETELKYAYEEIFARHGKIYSDTNFEKYFNSKDWYSPNPSFSENDLTSIERENAKYINEYILSHKTTNAPAVSDTPVVNPTPSSDNNDRFYEEYYYQHHYGDNTYIIPDSSVRRLSASELYGYTPETLALIRNEIYARNGYVFSKQKYIDYFSSKMWYSPNPNFNESFLNEIEKYNIQLIKSME